MHLRGRDVLVKGSRGGDQAEGGKKMKNRDKVFVPV